MCSAGSGLRQAGWLISVADIISLRKAAVECQSDVRGRVASYLAESGRIEDGGWMDGCEGWRERGREVDILRNGGSATDKKRSKGGMVE